MRFCLCFSASIIATSTILSYLAAAEFAFATSTDVRASTPNCSRLCQHGAESSNRSSMLFVSARRRYS